VRRMKQWRMTDIVILRERQSRAVDQFPPLTGAARPASASALEEKTRLQPATVLREGHTIPTQLEHPEPGRMGIARLCVSPGCAPLVHGRRKLCLGEDLRMT
jgi:hypothetical protein